MGPSPHRLDSSVPQPASLKDSRCYVLVFGWSVFVRRGLSRSKPKPTSRSSLGQVSGTQVQWQVGVHTTRHASHKQHHTVSPPVGHPILQFATRLQLREQKLLQYGRAGKLWVEQNAARNSQSIYRATEAVDNNELQKVRKALLPLLQKSRSEPSYPTTVSMGPSGVGLVGWAARACDLHITDLGGKCGMEPTAWGNVCTSFWRRSSNSEYLECGQRSAPGFCHADANMPLANLHGTALGIVSREHSVVPGWAILGWVVARSLHKHLFRSKADKVIGCGGKCVQSDMWAA